MPDRFTDTVNFKTAVAFPLVTWWAAAAAGIAVIFAGCVVAFLRKQVASKNSKTYVVAHIYMDKRNAGLRVHTSVRGEQERDRVSLVAWKEKYIDTFNKFCAT